MTDFGSLGTSYLRIALCPLLDRESSIQDVLISLSPQVLPNTRLLNHME